MFKKIIFTFLAFLILFQGNITPVSAQENQWYDSNILVWFTKVYDNENSQEIFGERYTAAQVQWVVYSLIVLPMNMLFDSSFTACWLKSLDSGSDVWLCFVNPVVIQRFLDLVNFIKALSPVIYAPSIEPIAQTDGATFVSILLSERPISGISYFRNVVNKINLVPTARAQEGGFGYERLMMLQPLWAKARDLSYSLLVLVAIVMAFMVMFRTKISPQTVITAQSAIPKLITAIILITFSYAIAGLLIDLMYVIIGFVSAIMTPGSVAETYQTLTEGPGGAGLLGIMVVYSTLLPYFLAASLMAALNVTSLSGGSGFMISLVVIILMVILVFVLLFTWVKILVMLIRAMVSLFLLIIFGPFYILGGALTSSLGVGSWIKDMIANLAVFPLTGIMLLFSFIFLGAAIGPGSVTFLSLPSEINEPLTEIWTSMFGGWSGVINVTDTNSWAPPFLAFGGNSGALMLILVSVSIVTLIPKLSDIVKGFMSGRPFAYGTAIGEAYSQGAVAATGGAKATTSYFAERKKRNLSGKTDPAVK